MIAGRSIYDFVVEFIIFFFGIGVFLFPSPMPFNWWVLSSVGFLLLLFEHRKNTRESLEIALIVGVFLMSFDFIFENVGTFLGFWGCSSSSFFVLAVPIEVMLTCFFGGTAWSLYVLSVHATLVSGFKGQFNRSVRLLLILLDLIFFGVGGAAAEWALIQRGFMYYSNGWTIYHAFIAYFTVWSMLHILLGALARPRMGEKGESYPWTGLGFRR